MTNSLAEEYFLAEARPAITIYDYRIHSSLDDNFLLDADKNVLAFCIRNVLTDSECEELIELTEQHGIVAPGKEFGTLRTAKRTSQYENKDLSKIEERLKETINARILNDGMGEFHGIHSNWRVVRYDKGDSFCAHQDQMDSIQLKKPDGSKDFVVSFHTLLINLSPDGVQGGATRFYPDCKVGGTKEGQYQNAVDVFMPRGHAIVFRQKGLVHAGQPVTGEVSKYVAQAGVLRLLDAKTLIHPSIFRMGPGLTEFLAQLGQSATP